MSRPESIAIPWGEPNDLVWSPDGRQLACATDDGAVHLLDATTGEPVAALGDHDVDEVTAVDFGPGGSVVASTDLSSTVYTWSARTGTPIGQVVHEDGGHFLAYLADGRTLLSAGQTEACALIDVETMTVSAVLPCPAGEMRLVAISHDRSTLAAFTAHDRIALWDTASRESRAPLRDAELTGITCVAVSPDGKLVATGRFDGTILVWSLATASLRSRVAGHGDAVRFVAFSSQGDLLASTGADHTLRLWQAGDLTPAGFHPTPGEPGLASFAPDGQAIAADAGDGQLRIWTRLGETFPNPRAD